MATQTVPETAPGGVTLEQLDEIGLIVRKLVAVMDTLATGGMDEVDDKTVHAIGYDAYLSARRLQDLTDPIKPTRDDGPIEVKPVSPTAGRPPFSRDMFNVLVQAQAVAQVINTAAYQADAAEGIGGSAWAVTDMLVRVEEYIETSFHVTDGGTP